MRFLKLGLRSQLLTALRANTIHQMTGEAEIQVDDNLF